MVTLTNDELAELTPEQKAAHFAAEENTVFGENHQKRNGAPVENGIGSPSQPSLNSLAAIRKWEGPEACDKAVADIVRRNPEYAKRLGLS